jgi:hypothetical protein
MRDVTQQNLSATPLGTIAPPKTETRNGSRPYAPNIADKAQGDQHLAWLTAISTAAFLPISRRVFSGYLCRR